MSNLVINANSIYDRVIRIGRQTENLVSAITFNVQMWIEEYGLGECVLNVKRNGDGSAYPVPMTIADGMTTWTITDTDTARSGRGEIQLVYHAGDKVKTSPIFTIRCGESIVGNGEPPSGYEDWLTELGEMTAQVEAAKTSSEASAQSASASAQRAETASRLIPTVTVEQTPTGAEITVTDSTGQTTTATLVKGKDGSPGAAGPKGDKGDMGEQGPQGIPGPAGSDADIIRFLPVDSASGVIASFSDGADDIPLKSLVVGIEPVQDLHGYENPWPAGGGVNLLDFGKITVSGTHYGMTFSKGQNEGTVTVTGTLTVSGGAVAPIIYADNSLSGKGYVFLTEHISGNSVVDLSRTYGFRTENERAIAVYLNGTVGQSYTETIRISVYAPPAPTSWTPYSNICPITGHTGANVTRTGKNLFDKLEYKNLISNHEYIDSSYYCRKIQLAPNTTYTVSFSAKTTSTVILLMNKYLHVNERGFVDLRGTSGVASYTTGNEGYLYIGVYYFATDASVNNRLDACDIQIELGSTATAYEPYAAQSISISFPSDAGTVYGGTLDVTTGKLTVTKGFIQSYNGEALPGVWISDMDVYAQGATPTTGAEVCYNLTTPITYQLTPTEVKSLLRQNNIWNDTGDTTVEYRADTSAYIAKKIAEAISALS